MDLSDVRSYMVVAGMGGGACIPSAISHHEIAAWAELSGNAPAPWEIQALRAMDKAWRAAHAQKSSAPVATSQHQRLGDYCKGERVEECRRSLGPALEQACATCPN